MCLVFLCMHNPSCVRGWFNQVVGWSSPRRFGRGGGGGGAAETVGRWCRGLIKGSRPRGYCKLRGRLRVVCMMATTDFSMLQPQLQQTSAIFPIEKLFHS